MSEPQTRIDGVRQQSCRVNDAEQTTLITVVAVSLAYAEVWAVTRNGAARKIGRTPEGAIGKIDSAMAEYFDDGTVRLWAAAADPGGSGSTSHTVFFDFPHEVKPVAPTVTAVDQAARDQALKATDIAKAADATATAAQSNAAAAVGQANAATNMAHSAIDQNEIQDAQITALDARTSALEDA